MKEVKVEFESVNEHYNKLMQPINKLKALDTYLRTMFPNYSLSINPQATEAILNHPKDKDYVMIHLSKNYMISTVTYHSNEEIYEND